MSTPEPLGSIFESIARRWRTRFIEAAVRPPAGKHVLCAYVSTIDRCLPVTEPLLQAMIRESGVTAARIADARGAASLPGGRATTRGDVVLALLWSLEHQGGRIGVDEPGVLDWLSDLFARFGNDETPGGAPAAMIDTLTRLCREPNAAVFTVFHSEKQASIYASGIRFLTADALGRLGDVDAAAYHRVRMDRPADPDVRNYPLSYQTGEHLAWGPDPAERVRVANGPDRLICTARYLHFDVAGHVSSGAPPASIDRIFQFPGLTEIQRDAATATVAAAYPYMTLTGLQGAGKEQRPAIERELGMLLGKVTLHIELSGPRNLDWLKELLPRYVSSVGVNDDELPAVCQEITGATAAADGQYDSVWAFYQDARALAAAFDLPRLYVHTHLADLVLRREPVEDDELLAEILADLYAKWIVSRWLGMRTSSGPLPDVDLKREGLEALLTFMAQVAGLSGKSLFGWLSDTARLAQKGYFTVADDYAVALIPVAWFHGSLAQTIITTGAGDRTSAVSFVQSCFSQPRPVAPA